MNAPHPVCDKAKFDAIVEAFRLGLPIPPVAAMGETALTGSHRIAAQEFAARQWNAQADGWENSPEPILEAVEVSDEDYLAACELIGVEHHLDDPADLSRWVAALWCVTEDAELKACLADQRNEYADDTAETLAG